MSEADLADALARSGYIRQNKEFSSFRDLISFVRQIHEEWLRKVGLPTSGSLSAEDFIAEINPLMIWDVIERIDNDLVKAGLYDQAVALLVSMNKISTVGNEPQSKDSRARFSGQSSLGTGAWRELSQIRRRGPPFFDSSRSTGKRKDSDHQGKDTQ